MFILVDALSYNDLAVRHANKLKERNASNKHKRLKYPNWRKGGQLAIYRYSRGVELVIVIVIARNWTLPLGFFRTNFTMFPQAIE